MTLRSLLIAAIAATLFMPTSAPAAQGHSEKVTGYEYYATSTDGKFAGTAAGALRGAWSADVRHSALCLSCTTTATVTGGRFILGTVLNGIPTLVSGSFTGGTVQLMDEGTNCTNQTFTVDGILDSVGKGSGGSGSGSFDITLTHYRMSLLGRCVTYGASVAGTLTLAL